MLNPSHYTNTHRRPSQFISMNKLLCWRNIDGKRSYTTGIKCQNKWRLKRRYINVRAHKLNASELYDYSRGPVVHVHSFSPPLTRTTSWISGASHRLRLKNPQEHILTWVLSDCDGLLQWIMIVFCRGFPFSTADTFCIITVLYRSLETSLKSNTAWCWFHVQDLIHSNTLDMHHPIRPLHRQRS